MALPPRYGIERFCGREWLHLEEATEVVLASVGKHRDAPPDSQERMEENSICFSLLLEHIGDGSLKSRGQDPEGFLGSIMVEVGSLRELFRRKSWAWPLIDSKTPSDGKASPGPQPTDVVHAQFGSATGLPWAA
jgi:hypothetical protein